MKNFSFQISNFEGAIMKLFSPTIKTLLILAGVSWVNIGWANPRPLTDILEEFGEKYQVFFTYDSELLGNEEVEFEFKTEESLNQAIDRLLANTGFRYDSFSDKYFIIYKDDKKGSKNARKLKRKIKQIQKLEKKGKLSLQRRQKSPGKHFNNVAKSLTEMQSGLLVQGKVSDIDGDPLMGANIIVKDAQKGTITELDGSFQLRVPPTAKTLVFSYIGYETKELDISKNKSIEVVLKPDDFALEEVVVLGYGTAKKQDATGVVATVSDEDFNKSAIISPAQLMAGQIAGVQVLSNTGRPGGQISIRIRGGTSLNASNEPLYVIDGIPVDNSPHNPAGFDTGGNSPLNSLNPNDIATITVLKDASATAIYGSRGANGVVLINTKKGRLKSKGALSYHTWFSVASPKEKIDLFDAKEFREKVEGYAPNRLIELGFSETNWQEEIYRTASGQNHTLSFSSGADNLGFRVSLGYLNQEGILKGSETERLSTAINYHHRFFNDQLKIDANFKASRTADQYAPGGIITDAIRFDPTQSIEDESSQWAGFFEYANSQANKNPVAKLRLIDDEGNTYRSLGDIQFDYQIPFLRGLSAKLNVGYDISTGVRKRFIPNNLRTTLNNNGEIRIANFSRTNKLLDAYLNYRRDFLKLDSQIDFIAGYSFQHFTNEFPEIWAWDLSSNAFSFNSLSPARHFSASTNVLENRLVSFFGRINYSFKNRYLLTATLRQDGSSRFGPSNRWGTFPSAAVAWKIIEEPFMNKLQAVFSNLKIRLGWGITGNQEIGDFRYLPTYTFSDSRARYQFGDEFVITARPNGVDPSLKWEETQSYNLGIDFGLFEGRFSGSLEYYYKITKDLLSEVVVPAGSNLTDIILTNIGSVENKGVELSLNTFPVSNLSTTWKVGFNFSFNKNNIIKLTSFNNPAFQGFLTGQISGGVGNNVQILREGQSVYSFFVFRHKRDESGIPLADNVDHNEDGFINQLDIYEDLNGDGIMNDLDKAVYKNPAPDVIVGLNSSLSIHNFEMSFSLRGNFGNYVYNNVASNGAHFGNITSEKVPTNVVRSVEETHFVSPQYFSDYYIENASFVRLDHITFGYRFKGISSKYNLRLYSSLQNLFVITNYSGLDPEIGNISNDGLNPRFGIDDNVYPRARTILFGLSLEI